jgi:hypothetical protein
VAERSTGWIQDPGRLENLIKVVECFDYHTRTHIDLITNLIPSKILPHDGRADFIRELNSRNGYRGYPKINYRSLVGTAFAPRANARCNGIIQALIPGQRRQFISDWTANNFIRWADTLGFIKYYTSGDAYSITDLGLRLTQSGNLDSKFKVIEDAFLQYPPVTRILELLYTQYQINSRDPLLTKFELGEQLGFRGEDGFTAYPQHLVIQAMVLNPQDRNRILTNWEGSSDKYARMICGWLRHPGIRWVRQRPKTVSANIAGQTFTDSIPQSYQITIQGIVAFKRSKGLSRHPRVSKRVLFEMLATKGTDKVYLRTRRALVLKYLHSWRTLQQIKSYLQSKGFDTIPERAIQDETDNFKRIGLDIRRNTRLQYKNSDTVVGLVIPRLPTPQLPPSYITELKLNLSAHIEHVDHSYFDLIDLGFDGQQSLLYELRIVALLNLMTNLRARHLPGGNRPEIIAYYPDTSPRSGVIMDAKARAMGFNLPNSERDKMIRYINEYSQKNPSLNPNKWWETFRSHNYPQDIKYGFVSSTFIGQFLAQMNYIFTQTGVTGGAITSEKLIEKVDAVLRPNTSYSLTDFFNEMSNNCLVQ